MARITVIFVCLGNICRSPMAEFVFKDALERRGLSRKFHVYSTGCMRYHANEPPDRRTLKTLEAHNIPYDKGKRVMILTRDDLMDADYVIPMDEDNLSHILGMMPKGSKCEVDEALLFSEGRGVDDPWYTENFEATFETVLKGSERLIDHILEQHPELID